MPNKYQKQKLNEMFLDETLFPEATLKRSSIILGAGAFENPSIEPEDSGVYIPPTEQHSACQKLYESGVCFPH